jgi:hypothetical protein
MPEMVYGQSALGITVPAGWYVTKFVGTEDRGVMKDSKFGKGDQPRMAWVFEVTDGERKGEKIAQETGTWAGARTAAARIIAGLNGGPAAVGQTVNTDQFIGRAYRVKVAVNPDSEKGRLHVADIEVLAGGGSATGAATGSAPPPRRPQPTRPAGVLDPKQRYWIDTGGAEEVQGDTEAVQAYLRDNKLSAADLMLCPVGGIDWKPAKDFGFAGV